jgi:uncharacterized membrane protein
MLSVSSLDSSKTTRTYPAHISMFIRPATCPLMLLKQVVRKYSGLPNNRILSVLLKLVFIFFFQCHLFFQKLRQSNHEIRSSEFSELFRLT